MHLYDNKLSSCMMQLDNTKFVNILLNIMKNIINYNVKKDVKNVVFYVFVMQGKLREKVNSRKKENTKTLVKFYYPCKTKKSS